MDNSTQTATEQGKAILEAISASARAFGNVNITSSRPRSGHVKTVGLPSLDIRTHSDDNNSILSTTRPHGHYQEIHCYDFGDKHGDMTIVRRDADYSPPRKGVSKVRVSKTVSEMSDEDLLRSVNRSKKEMKRRCLMINADHMLTLTYRENEQCLDKTSQDFARFIRLVRVRFPDFQYVAVHEYQKRGSIHYHLAIHGFYPVTFLRFCWLKAITPPAQAFTKSFGNIDIQCNAYGAQWQKGKIARYLVKYMGKNIQDTDVSRKRYSSSRGIPEPLHYVYFLPLGTATIRFCSQLLHKLVGRPPSSIFEPDDPVWHMKFLTTY